eukprot:m.340191 g.340191  ORF g.340191 m.340191 type:complete len:86 (-) comp19172_c0_seq1:84-341(-)
MIYWKVYAMKMNTVAKPKSVCVFISMISPVKFCASCSALADCAHRMHTRLATAHSHDSMWWFIKYMFFGSQNGLEFKKLSNKFRN